MNRLSPDEIKIVRCALQTLLRLIAIDAFHTLQRDPTQTHRIIEDRTAPVQRIIQKLQV